MNRSSQIAHIGARTYESGPYLEKLLAELDRAEISARIKTARTEAGITQPELGDILHVHFRTIQTWEDLKDGRIPWDRLDEIARATGRTRDWLLHGDLAVEVTPDQLEALAAQVEQVLAEVRALREIVALLAVDPQRETPDSPPTPQAT